MRDIENLNKFRQKTLEMIFQLSQIDGMCQDLLTNFDENDLQEIGKVLESFDLNTEMMRNSLILFIKQLSNIDEDDEIIAAETDEGYKI